MAIAYWGNCFRVWPIQTPEDSEELMKVVGESSLEASWQVMKREEEMRDQTGTFWESLGCFDSAEVVMDDEDAAHRCGVEE